MRLFFAAFPDGETRRRIASAAGALALSDGARRIPAENYHMTLAFVGDASNAQAAALRTIEPIEVPASTVRFDTY
jgi:RNA 2',3'-cyclic 3'-phosphodiesterase